MIKILINVGKPFACAVGYVAPLFIFDLMFGHFSIAMLIVTAIVFGYISLYFWLLDYFGESFLFWLILIVGFFGPIVIMLVPGFINN